MIRRDDFDIEIGHNDQGTYVRVMHKPTGNARLAESIGQNAVGRVLESAIAELRGLLFAPNDVVFDTGRSSGGDFIRVRHWPTGIERAAMRRESTHEILLDAVLEEVYAGTRRQDAK
ncbi:MAG: hypothetical protein AB7O62_11735 [Pirellulales bacterium]